MPKQRTPEESAKFREAIFKGIAAGKEVKEIAPLAGCEEAYVYVILRRAGYQKMILSPEEHFILKQLRTGKGKFVASLPKPSNYGKGPTGY
jgi:hypothetical protein